MKIMLENAVVAEKMVKVEIRPPLYASKCDGCGKVFKMLEYFNDMGLAKLEAIFDDAHMPHHLSNHFEATVCSFQCAHEVFANGGWKKMPKYREFADLDLSLVRAKLLITSFVQDEVELRRDWITSFVQNEVELRRDWKEKT